MKGEKMDEQAVESGVRETTLEELKDISKNDRKKEWRKDLAAGALNLAEKLVSAFESVPTPETAQDLIDVDAAIRYGAEWSYGYSMDHDSPEAKQTYNRVDAITEKAGKAWDFINQAKKEKG